MIKVGSACLPAEPVRVNGQAYGQSELLLFGAKAAPITLTNPSISPTNVILFGGEPYTEPTVIQGPFVMNRHEEITTAYEDFLPANSGRFSTRRLPPPSWSPLTVQLYTGANANEQDHPPISTGKPALSCEGHRLDAKALRRNRSF